MVQRRFCFALIFAGAASQASASPLWGHPHPCVAQCAANAQLSTDLAYIQDHGNGYYMIYQGTVTSGTAGVAAAPALGVGYGYGEDAILVGWSKDGPRLSFNGTVDENGNPTGAAVSVLLANSTTAAQANVTLPDAGVTFGTATSDQDYWNISWFDLNQLALSGTSPYVVSGDFAVMPKVNLDTALALEALGLWEGPALAGHVTRGAQTSTLAVGTSVSCGGTQNATWSATITIPNDDIQNASAGTAALSPCR